MILVIYIRVEGGGSHKVNGRINPVNVLVGQHSSRPIVESLLESKFAVISTKMICVLVLNTSLSSA